MTYLVLKPDYPHESASNSLFSIKKGTFLECPVGYKPSSSFQVCETKEAAREYINLAYHAEQPDRTTKAGEKDRHAAAAAYPLFRRVASPTGGEAEYQLFARDIHRFLSQHEEEVLSCMRAINLHKNTAQRLYNYERQHFRRQPVLNFLEAIIKGEEQEEKEEVEEPSKGVTTSKTISQPTANSSDN